MELFTRSVVSTQFDCPQLGQVEQHMSPAEASGAGNIIPQLLHFNVEDVAEAVGVSFSPGCFLGLAIHRTS